MVEVSAEARSINSEIVRHRRHIHNFPEIGLETPRTAEYIAGELRQMGIEVTTGVGGHGAVGLIRGTSAGKCIGLRADMDALPIQEETGLPFASSRPGMMHACGHDSHVAMLLGAAKILSRHRDRLRGSVKLVFQPGEEGPGGAKAMIDDGVLENPRVDAIVALHGGGTWDHVATGQIGVCSGPMMACLDRIDLVFKGQAAHGAAPFRGIDAVMISAQALSTLQTVVSREIRPWEPVVVTIGKIRGGTGYNILAGDVTVEGTVRTMRQDLREVLARRIGEIATGVARSMRGDCDYKYTYGYPPLSNDTEFTSKFAGWVEEEMGEDRVVPITTPTMGGDDFAYFLQEVPGTYFFLKTINPAKGLVYSQHNSRFDIDEDVLWVGTAAMVTASMKFLGHR
jgi:amidohydrolase